MPTKPAVQQIPDGQVQVAASLLAGNSSYTYNPVASSPASPVGGIAYTAPSGPADNAAQPAFHAAGFGVVVGVIIALTM
jgi:hypothetical protein